MTVLIVGAGVIGCAVAYELAAAGASVEVIDARAPGQGASRASAGMLLPFLEGHGSETFRELGRRSFELYEAFLARVRADSGREVLFEQPGTLEVALTDEDVDRLVAQSGAHWKAGVEARWVPPAALEDVEPALTPAAKGALLVPRHALVRVDSLVDALTAAAERRGARFTAGAGAVRIRALPERHVGVDVDGRTWEAERVVLAAGSWSSGIAVEGVDRIPVRPVRGQILQLRARPGLVRHILWGAGGYLVPWPDGTVLAGATSEDVGFDERTTDEGVRELRAVAATLVPALADAPLVEARAGLRPQGLDELPLVGSSRVVAGLVYATAHFRNGILLAPWTAKVVTELVLGRRRDPSLTWVDPARAGRL